MGLTRVPCSITEARRFVGAHHRHCAAPIGAMFAVGVARREQPGVLRGVGMAGRPVSRIIATREPATVEVLRVCTLGDRNACSMLYGALVRAARALGWRRAITYTLAAEPGASLKASGWRPDREVPAGEWVWAGDPGRGQMDLWGRRRAPPGPKRRWVIDL